MIDLKYTAAIPTRERPEELKICIEKILKQALLPEKIIVIDGGNLNADEVREWCGKYKNRFIYLKNEIGGSMSSLNKALEVCETEWILILDDDIYLNDDFMAILIKFIEHCKVNNIEIPDAIAGIPLLIKMKKESQRFKFRRFLEKVFMLSGGTEGRFLPSTFCSDYETGVRPDHPYQVEHVPGGLGLWKTSVIKEYRFDESFQGYAYGYDKYLAYRISRKHLHICIPEAKAIHAKSPNARLDGYNLFRMIITNQYRFYREIFEKKLYTPFFFYYAVLGMIIISFSGAVFSNEYNARIRETKGLLKGLIESIGKY